MINNEEKKVSTYVSIKNRNHNLIKEKGINLSDFVDKWIERDLMNEDGRIKELMTEKEKIEKEIQEITKEKAIREEAENKEVKILEKEQIEELIESINIITKNEKLFKVRLLRYKNLFDKEMIEDKFKRLLDKIKQIYIKSI
jgi:hypothetical protein